LKVLSVIKREGTGGHIKWPRYTWFRSQDLILAPSTYKSEAVLMEQTFPVR